MNPLSLTRSLMLGGAAAVAMAGAAYAEDNTAKEAQANNPPDAPRTWGEEARVNTAEGAPGVTEDGRVLSADGDADTVPQIAESPHAGNTAQDRFGDGELAGNTVAEESPEAAIIEEATDSETRARAAAVRGDVEEPTDLVAERDGAPSEEAVDKVLMDAQAEGAQNEVHIIPPETDEADISNPGEEQGEIMLAAHPEITDRNGENSDVELLQTFLAIDGDDDLLVTPAEWGAWQGWEAGKSPDFAGIDVNGTGVVGFGEYRVWNAIRAETGDAGS